jgi:hypothetical protein
MPEGNPNKKYTVATTVATVATIAIIIAFIKRF